MPKVNIFISHSEADKEIVGKFVDFLVTAELGGVGTIFCSSKQGFDIPNGMGGDALDPKQFIRDKLDKTTVVIAILTPNYWESKFSLCELGAAWAKTRLFALTVPPDTYKEAKAILSGSAVHQLTNANKLTDVMDEIAGMNDDADPASKNVRGRSGRFTTLAQSFAKTVEEYVASQKDKAAKADQKDSKDTQRVIKNAVGMITSIESNPDLLISRDPADLTRFSIGGVPLTNKRAGIGFDYGRAIGPDGRVRGRRANIAPALPPTTPRPTLNVDQEKVTEFARTVALADDALHALSQAVQTALFRYTNEGSASTQSLNPRQVQTAIDKGQFKGIGDDGQIQINFQNKDIAAFHDKFYKLGDLLAEMNDDTKNEARKNHGGVELNPDSWDFWVNLLDYKD